MFVDCYFSDSHASHGLVVPAGSDLDAYQGDLGDVIRTLKPLYIRKSAQLEHVYRGDVLVYVQREMALNGAGLVHRQVHKSALLEA
jgi:hypothetical protein